MFPVDRDVPADKAGAFLEPGLVAADLRLVVVIHTLELEVAVMQTMHDTAKALVALRTEEYRAGGGGLGAVLVAQRELHGVELKLVSDPGERRKVLAASLQAAKEIEKFAEARVESGMASQGELLEARLARLRAELVLLEG